MSGDSIAYSFLIPYEVFTTADLVPVAEKLPTTVRVDAGPVVPMPTLPALLSSDDCSLLPTITLPGLTDYYNPYLILNEYNLFLNIS